MKKLFVIIAALSLLMTACHKEDSVPTVGRYSVDAVNPQISSEVRHNLYVNKSEAAKLDMPKAAILKAFQMSESEFNTVWSQGEVEYGIIQTDKDGKPIIGGINWTQIKGAFFLNWNGKIITSDTDTSDAVLKIVQPTTDFWKMNVLGGKVYENKMAKGTCVDSVFYFEQVFYYESSDTVEVTFRIPWKLKIVKGDPRVKNEKTLDDDTRSWSATYGTADTVKYVVINDSIAKNVNDSIGVDPTEAPACAYIDGAPVYRDSTGFDGKVHKVFVKGTDLYFRADGTPTTKSDGDAALHLFRDTVSASQTKGQWVCKFTRNENTEGNDISVQIAFVKDEAEAMVYPVTVQNKTRKFMSCDSSSFVRDTVTFHISMLKTTNARVSSSFDFPKAMYDSLAATLKELKKSWTLAQLMERKLAILYGGTDTTAATRVESTISPYGHWFDSYGDVKTSSSTDKFVGMILTADESSGHCYVTVEKAKGSLPISWKDDKHTFVQWFYLPEVAKSAGTKDRAWIRIKYNITLVDEVK